METQLKPVWTINIDTLRTYDFSIRDRLAAKAAVDMLAEIDKEFLSALKSDFSWWEIADEGELPIRSRKHKNL